MQYLQLLDCVCSNQDGTAQKHSKSPEAEPRQHHLMQSSSSCAESRLQSPDMEDLRWVVSLETWTAHISIYSCCASCCRTDMLQHCLGLQLA